MASVSSRLEAVASVSAVSDVMRRLMENFTDDQKEKLMQWIKIIEDSAEANVQKLTTKQLKKRNPEVVAAAAVYDAFIEFESRTKVKVGLPFMERSLGRSTCIINNTWKRLFDNRVLLRGEFLDLVYTERNGSITDAISNVIQALERAVEESSSEVTDWLTIIQKDANDLSKTIMPDVASRYDPLLVAITTIYAAIQHYPGKMMIRITQRNLSLLSCTSPAMISKCWQELFGN